MTKFISYGNEIRPQTFLVDQRPEPGDVRRDGGAADHPAALAGVGAGAFWRALGGESVGVALGIGGDAADRAAAVGDQRDP